MTDTTTELKSDSSHAGSPPDSAAKAAQHAELQQVLERDRRMGAERVIELGRWFVLIFATVTANFPGQTTTHTVDVDLILGAWALFNLAQTLALVGNQTPGQITRYGMTGLDIIVASLLVLLTGGFTSNFGITFYVVIIASSLRYPVVGSILCASLISLAYLITGLVSGGNLTSLTGDAFASHLFLYYVVALTSGLLSKEMVEARAHQLQRTFELEHSALIELQDVDRVKSEFMMLASHELRTPLTKIKAWLTLMQDAGEQLPEEAREEGLAELKQETEHLARLTENLLCIAQLESGEIRLKAQPVEVNDVLKGVLARFVESADRDRFVCEVPEDASRVLADDDRLTLVLACLVDNALKFSPPQADVHITAKKLNANRVCLEVADQGRRIPDNQVDRVFASFYQVESPLVRQRGGFGVGLYLSRQLIERMGGDIWIDNSRVRGNTFVISLPSHV